MPSADALIMTTINVVTPDDLKDGMDEISTTDEEKEPIFANAPFFHPSRLAFKLIGLAFICFVSFDAYFCFDNPSALQRQILKDMDVKVSDYTVLYSIYSWPNVVLSVFGGFLVDAVFGIRLGTIIFSVLVTVGQIIFALGGLSNQFWLMIFGRFVMGLGGENVIVCQNMYSALWFKGPMLNLAFGLQMSISILGGAVNLWIMQPIYNSLRLMAPSMPAYVWLGLTILAGCGICLFSLACTVVLSFLDRYSSKVLKRRVHNEKASWARLKQQIGEIRRFSAQTWLICCVAMFYYCAIFPFIGITQTFYVMKYQFSVTDANTVNSLTYFVPLIASPIIGFIIDRTGKNIFWVMLCCAITGVAHTLIAFSFVTPYICTMLLGLSDALIDSSLFPLIVYAVPEKNLGTAYGVMQAGINLGLAVTPRIAGLIVDYKGYLVLEILFLLLIFITLTCTLLLWLVDYRRGGELNLSAKERNQKEDSEQTSKSE